MLYLYIHSGPTFLKHINCKNHILEVPEVLVLTTQHSHSPQVALTIFISIPASLSPLVIFPMAAASVVSVSKDRFFRRQFPTTSSPDGPFEVNFQLFLKLAKLSIQFTIIKCLSRYFKSYLVPSWNFSQLQLTLTPSSEEAFTMSQDNGLELFSNRAVN